MKLSEKTIESVSCFLDFYKIEIDYNAYSKKIKQHPDYPSILSYYDTFIDFNVSCNVLKIAENNIEELPFPLLAMLRDQNEHTVLTCIKRANGFYQYIKNNALVSLDKYELDSIWLGVVITIGDLDEIVVETNDVENHIINENTNPSNYANCRFLGMRNTVHNKSEFYRLNIEVTGNDNIIEVDEGTSLPSCTIKVRGNDNRLLFSKNCRISGEFVLDGLQNVIKIGEDTTIEQALLSASESKSIEVGKDCMFSNNITMQTSDSHSIVSNKTNKRINHPGNIVVKNHVWIGPFVNILKGVTIESGSVIGIGSIVTKNVPKECIFAGNPAKIIKSDISWQRELLKE